MRESGRRPARRGGLLSRSVCGTMRKVGRPPSVHVGSHVKAAMVRLRFQDESVGRIDRLGSPKLAVPDTGVAAVERSEPPENGADWGLTSFGPSHLSPGTWNY